jgi:hypothetical protein
VFGLPPRSINNTLFPEAEQQVATVPPPAPPPITITSKSFSMQKRFVVVQEDAVKVS